jgi:hypothetical protein
VSLHPAGSQVPLTRAGSQVPYSTGGLPGAPLQPAGIQRGAPFVRPVARCPFVGRFTGWRPRCPRLRPGKLPAGPPPLVTTPAVSDLGICASARTSTTCATAPANSDHPDPPEKRPGEQVPMRRCPASLPKPTRLRLVGTGAPAGGCGHKVKALFGWDQSEGPAADAAGCICSRGL